MPRLEHPERLWRHHEAVLRPGQRPGIDANVGPLRVSTEG